MSVIYVDFRFKARLGRAAPVSKPVQRTCLIAAAKRRIMARPYLDVGMTIGEDILKRRGVNLPGAKVMVHEGSRLLFTELVLHVLKRPDLNFYGHVTADRHVLRIDGTQFEGLTLTEKTVLAVQLEPEGPTYRWGYLSLAVMNRIQEI